MSDRELLELAAKAAGLHIDDWNCDMAVMYFWDGDPQNPERNHHYWSPLTDDGDALRLAVKTGMNLALVSAGGFSVAAARFSEQGAPESEVVEPHNSDPYAATRRAIVRAAASIGEQLCRT